MIASVAGLLLACAPAASAASPTIVSISVAEGSVTATGVTLQGSINPNGLSTTYRFEYLTQAAYEANLEAQPPRDPFSGAAIAPANGAGLVGSQSTPVPVSQRIAGLAAATAYRYRLRAVNSSGFVLSVDRPFATAAPTNAFELLDHRGWEMVSPVEKGGGAVQPPGTISGGGVFQAAAGGGSFSFSSADSFGAGAQAAPSGSQYLAGRGGGGWASTNITTPMLSGSYGREPDGVPYQLFSSDLRSGLLSNGERCRGAAGGECPVANPALPGSGAPSGYRDYYRRTASGSFESMLTTAALEHTSLGPAQFELKLVAATPDLAHVVVSTCAALTADATEVPALGGCDPAEQNLYEWSGGGLSLVNVLPGESTGTPGAVIAARVAAVSADGSRVYFSELEDGALYVSDEGRPTRLVPETIGGGASLKVASGDGRVAYFTRGSGLYRYDSEVETSTLIASEVTGVLGGSADGSYVYFQTGAGLQEWHGGTTSQIAAGADASDAGDDVRGAGTARVSRDGLHLLFLSDAELTGFPSEGNAEAFLYGPPPGGQAPLLTCVSCNPSGERTHAAASIPGARPNGAGADASDFYPPRVLSASGNRVFFESADSLVPQDTNKGTVDVYEWEADGEGTCAKGGGCVQLISSGHEAAASYFLDADESGGEAFFLTASSLYPLDPGSYDVYVARENGGFSLPETRIPCAGDACQVLPEAPEDPTPGTLQPNAGNPPSTPPGHKRKKKHKKHHHKKKTKATGVKK